ncbi:MAG: inositol monophosphatase family protein [Myxococcota bacterium]|nr:inositol monophosphatase family protein [Myxococcota bacterium]
MHPILDTAVRAARRAGDIILAASRKATAVEVESKGPADYVTEIDRAAEAAVLEIVRAEWPGHAVLAEERGAQGDARAEYLWIVDPLDGTTNFVRGVPHFAVSIGVRRAGASAEQPPGAIEHAAVLDPLRDELFTTSADEGARLNGRPIRVTSRPGLDGALLGTGIPFKAGAIERLDRYLATMRALLPGTAGIRRPGSAALDLAYVAAGRFDGFWEFGLSPWDVAAGVLLVREAGGIVTDTAGGDGWFETGDILAAGRAVHAAMLAVLRGI